MIIVTKYFTDSKDNFKPYNVDDKADLGKERNTYLVGNGYAKWDKKDKQLKPKLETKPAPPKTRTVNQAKKPK